MLQNGLIVVLIVVPRGQRTLKSIVDDMVLLFLARCCVGKSFVVYTGVALVAVLTLKMVPPPDAARWTALRPPLDSFCKTCPSGESPSCTAPTRTSRCHQSPCRATHPSPVRGESKTLTLFIFISFYCFVFYTIGFSAFIRRIYLLNIVFIFFKLQENMKSNN